jgi:hypothetical protein
MSTENSSPSGRSVSQSGVVAGGALKDDWADATDKPASTNITSDCIVKRNERMALYSFKNF